MLHSPKLLPATDYARDAAKKIAKARYRVAMIATTFRGDDELSSAIMDELVRAAERGVEVSIYADVFTYLEPKEFIIRSPKRQPARAIQAMKLERRIKKAGGNFHWLGRKANALFAGRTHSKWTVIDDIAYVGGGVNMDDESFSNVDYMFRFSDQALADRHHYLKAVPSFTLFKKFLNGCFSAGSVLGLLVFSRLTGALL